MAKKAKDIRAKASGQEWEAALSEAGPAAMHATLGDPKAVAELDSMAMAATCRFRTDGFRFKGKALSKALKDAPEPWRVPELTKEAASIAADIARGDRSGVPRLKSVWLQMNLAIANARIAARGMVEEADARDVLLRDCLVGYLADDYEPMADATLAIGDHTPKMADERSYCLRAEQGGEGVVVATSAFREGGFAKWTPTDVAETLRATGGHLGGGSETLVVDQTWCVQNTTVGRADTSGPRGKGFREESCYTIDTTDPHVVAYFDQQAIGKHASSGVASTLMARDSKGVKDIVVSAVAAPVRPRFTRETLEGMDTDGLKRLAAEVTASIPEFHLVRSLLVVEGCRLQGFPDDRLFAPMPEKLRDDLSPEEITDLKRTLDAIGLSYDDGDIASWMPESKMWKAIGNSICTVPLRWLAERIVEEVRRSRPDLLGDVAAAA